MSVVLALCMGVVLGWLLCVVWVLYRQKTITQRLSTLLDMSGHGHHATQRVSIHQPTLVPHANGQPVILRPPRVTRLMWVTEVIERLPDDALSPVQRAKLQAQAALMDAEKGAGR